MPELLVEEMRWWSSGGGGAIPISNEHHLLRRYFVDGAEVGEALGLALEQAILSAGGERGEVGADAVAGVVGAESLPAGGGPWSYRRSAVGHGAR